MPDVGIRVKVRVKYQSGVIDSLSLTVNTSANAEINWTLEHIVADLTGGYWTGPHGSGRGIEDATVESIAVVEGGFDSPSLSY